MSEKRRRLLDKLRQLRRLPEREFLAIVEESDELYVAFEKLTLPEPEEEERARKSGVSRRDQEFYDWYTTVRRQVEASLRNPVPLELPALVEDGTIEEVTKATKQASAYCVSKQSESLMAHVRFLEQFFVWNRVMKELLAKGESSTSEKQSVLNEKCREYFGKSYAYLLKACSRVPKMVEKYPRLLLADVYPSYLKMYKSRFDQYLAENVGEHVFWSSSEGVFKKDVVIDSDNAEEQYRVYSCSFDEIESTAEASDASYVMFIMDEDGGWTVVDSDENIFGEEDEEELALFSDGTS